MTAPLTDALATRNDHQVSVMLWNYEDVDRTDSHAAVKLQVAGMPKNAGRVLLRHYRIDAIHSNSYTVWKQMGSPQKPSKEQFAMLEASGQLELLESPRYVDTTAGNAELQFDLPLQGISLVQLS